MDSDKTFLSCLDWVNDMRAVGATYDDIISALELTLEAAKEQAQEEED